MSSRNEILVFVGPPGSGKGSLSQLCVQKFDWVQLSTGNLCRKHIAEATEIGKAIDFAIKSGKLISNSLVTQMVCDWLGEQSHEGKTIILDGYPRTADQARRFNEVLRTGLPQFNLKIVRLSILDEVVIERLSNRYVCGNTECQAVYSLASGSEMKPRSGLHCDRCKYELLRRKDDEINAIKERLALYHSHEKELLDFYRDAGQRIQEVDVDKPLTKVFGTFIQLMQLENS